MIDWNSICDGARGFNLSDSIMAQLQPLFRRCDPSLLLESARNLCQDYSEERVRKAFPQTQDRNMFRLLCIIANFQSFRQSYQRQNFPEKMFQDVIGDLKVWLNTTTPDWGYPGISDRIIHWFIDIFRGEVKQFGRLQCNTFHLFGVKKSIYRKDDGQIILREWNDTSNPPEPDLAYQDKVVNLHIPASGRLIARDCVSSLLEMAEFMKAFRPDYDLKAYVCYSWLLSPFFTQHLKPESHIRQFQNLGHRFPMPELDEAKEIKWRLWGDAFTDTPPEQLSTDNSIRKAVARQLQLGQPIPCGCMVIFPDELAELAKTHL